MWACKKRIIFSVLVLFTEVIFGFSLAIKFDFLPAVRAQGPAVLSVSAEGPRIEDAVINVASTTGRAVVSISTEHVQKIKSRRLYFSYPFGGGSPFGDDDPFRRFFDDFLGEIPEREYKQAGLGSGVIINNEGYILTNEHVIDEADKITVTLSDGREFKAEIKGQDPRSDLAVIKIDAHNLPVAALGDSDSLKIGQWVVAIGNPYGFVMQNPEPTVTTGVISALHRSLGKGLSQDRDYSDLIQTDAAINPGNSGGPLVNLKGELVGVNVAIFSTTGGYQGIGFAIPINNAKRIISKLIEGKKVVYGWLGITVQDLSEDLAGHFGLSGKKGVLVSKILKDGPSERAGVKEGDIIQSIDNNNIENVKELLNLVGKSDVGRSLKLIIVRDKKQLVLDIVVGERPQNTEETAYSQGSVKWRGLDVQDLSPEIARRFRIEDEKGVVVIDVEPDSPSDEAGIIPGDVLLEINKQAIKDISDYNYIVKNVQGRCLLRTSRGYFLLKEENGKK